MLSRKRGIVKKYRARKRPRYTITQMQKPVRMVVSPTMPSTTSGNFRTGGFVDIENKYIDERGYNVAFSTDWSTTLNPAAGCLNAAAQNDTPSGRDGRKITLTSIFIRGVIIDHASSGHATIPDPAVVTVALVLDTQTNNATITPANVFNTLNPQYLPVRNLEHARRYRVLWLRTFIITSNTDIRVGEGDYEASGNAVQFKLFKRLNIPVLFNATTASVGSITDNSLHLIGGASTANAKINYVCRVRFTG